MRTLLLTAGAALALSACGGAEKTETTTVNTTTEDANAAAADNMLMDQNMAMNGSAMDHNNMDPATHNAMMQDMNTNSPDTNLANGM